MHINETSDKQMNSVFKNLRIYLVRQGPYQLKPLLRDNISFETLKFITRASLRGGGDKIKWQLFSIDRGILLVQYVEIERYGARETSFIYGGKWVLDCREFMW